MNTSTFLKTAALGLAFVTAQASAEFLDGNELHIRMNSSETWEKAYSYGYVAGVTDAGLGVTHCAPANVTLGQVMDLVRNHLTQYPERRNRSGDVLINQALRAAWPCPQRSRGQGT